VEHRQRSTLHQTEQEHHQATDEPEPEPNFARGLTAEPEPGTEDHGRFSEGQEQTPATDQPEPEPSFARGLSAEPRPGTEEHGRFSEGQEHPLARGQ
jgi:hypothetical protein